MINLHQRGAHMLPKNRPPSHPGEILLKGFLEPQGISQLGLAEHLRWTYARLNEIINQRRAVTMDSALSFAEAFCTQPEFWLDLQRNYDLWHAKQTHVTVLPLPQFLTNEKK